MSSASELREIFDELQDLPEDLQKSITSKFAKLSGLKQLTGETALQRDGARLDARQRAYYKKMGLELPEDGDGEMITNILADNITIGEDPVIAKRNVSADSKDNKAVDPPVSSEPQPPPQIKPNGRVPGWAKWAIAGLLGSNLIGGGTLAYFLTRPDTSNPGGSVFRFDTELPPWMDSSE